MANQTEQHQPLIKHNMFDMQSQSGKMKRFWGLIHVRPLTIFIGFAEFILILFQALIAGSYLASSSHKTAAMIHMTVVILTFIAVFLLLAGIFYKVPLLLGPHIVMQVAVTCTLLLLTIGSIVCIVSGTSVQMRLTLVHSKMDLSVEPISMGSHFNFSTVSHILAGLILCVSIGYFFSSMFCIWCLGVVLDCYRSLTAEQLEKESLPRVVNGEPKPEVVVEPKTPIPAAISFTDF